MTRFADLIRAEGFAPGIVGGYELEDRAHAFAAAQAVADMATRALTDGCAVFDVTSVAAACADGLTIPVSPPAMRPPFDVVWAEYTLPSNWAHGTIGPGRHRPERIGGLFRTAAWEDRWTLNPRYPIPDRAALEAEWEALKAEIVEAENMVSEASARIHGDAPTGALRLMEKASDAPAGHVDLRTAQGAFDDETRRKILGGQMFGNAASHAQADAARRGVLDGMFGNVASPSAADPTARNLVALLDEQIADAERHLADLTAQREQTEADVTRQLLEEMETQRANLLGGGLAHNPQAAAWMTQNPPTAPKTLRELLDYHLERADTLRARVRTLERLLARVDELKAADAAADFWEDKSTTYMNLHKLGETLHGEPRWAVVLDGFCRIGSDNVAGMGQWAWALDEHGDPCSDTAYNVPPDPAHPADIARRNVDRYSQMAMVLALAMSLTNVHNVDVVEHHATPKLQRARQRRDKPPLVSYRTLAIRPMTARGAAGARVTSEEGVRWHIRRGHFRDYRRSGLFGRDDLRRIFWFAATAAGNPERGAVVKDYEVEAP